MYQYLLFDLDGTLFDTSDGVLRSVQYALGKMGRPIPPLDDLRCFIGPPLVEIFSSFCDISRAEAEQATAFYRERYAVTGVLEVTPYPGIPELFAELDAAGFTIAVATGKPAVYSRQILANYGLDRYVRTLVTPELDGRRSEKCEIITCILDELGVSPADYGKVVMVGDRKFDIIGAHEVGIAALGVTYGFAPEGELTACGSDYLIDSVADLRRFFLEEQA
jgi:phosphoglycolate phosphatase